MQFIENLVNNPLETFLGLSLEGQMAIGLAAFLVGLALLVNLIRLISPSSKTRDEPKTTAPLDKVEQHRRAGIHEEIQREQPPVSAAKKVAPAPLANEILDEKLTQEPENTPSAAGAPPEAPPAPIAQDVIDESLSEDLYIDDEGEAESLPPDAEENLKSENPLSSRIGRLVENIPRRMRVNIPVRVEARISDDKATDLTSTMKGDLVEHRIETSPAMTVVLRAPDGGFIIEPLSLETQWVNNQRAASLGFINQPNFGEWQWRVTPLERGKKPLKLFIAAHLSASGATGANINLPQQEIEISVRINYGAMARKAALWTTLAVLGGLIAKFGETALDMAMAHLS